MQEVVVLGVGMHRFGKTGDAVVDADAVTRAGYVAAWWNLVNWDFVSKRYAAAKA